MIWHFAREKNHEILIGGDQGPEASKPIPLFCFIININKLKYYADI
jgi:hypothetical protein